MRFRRLLVIVAMGLALGLVSGARSAEGTVAQELTALLREFMDAAGRGDRAVFDRFFADDVIYTRATGIVITKAETMESLKKPEAEPPKEKTTYAAADITVHDYGDMAVVAFRLEGRTEQSDGKVATQHYRNTGTFLKRNGRWQAVAWQATKISEDAKAAQ
jgi:ketosteroid isomerase-like protein